MLSLLTIGVSFEPLARPLMLLVLLTPLLGLGLVLLAKPRSPIASRDAALAASLVTLFLTIALLAMHLANPASLMSVAPFAADTFLLVQSSLALGVDGISIWLIVMTAVLMPLAVLISTTAIRQQARAYYALLMLLHSAMLGVFLVRDLLWFYIFFEFTLVPLFFIIGIWGGAERRRAAYKFFIYTLAGTLLTLATFLYMGYRNGLDFSFDTLRETTSALPANLQILLFVGVFLGFAIKVPLFPLHTWLPLAHTEAPTAGSVILAGVLLKLGTYGFLRIGLGFLPKAALALAPLMGGLAVAGILYGALAAWVQPDFKKLIAYSSIAHLGFCILGMFTLNTIGLTGSVLVMVNHGLSTGALFLVAGMIYDRYHTRRFDQLGGLGRRMPVIAFFFVFFTLSSLGLPGLNGFVSEFLVLLGTATSAKPQAGLPSVLGWAYAVPAALGVVFSAVYLLHMVGRLIFGPLVEPVGHADVSRAVPGPGEGHDAGTQGHGDAGNTPSPCNQGEGRGEGSSAPHSETPEKLPPDANAREWAIMAPLAALILLLGVWPTLVTQSIRQPAEQLLRQVAVANAPPQEESPKHFWELRAYREGMIYEASLPAEAANSPLLPNAQPDRTVAYPDKSADDPA